MLRVLKFLCLVVFGAVFLCAMVSAQSKENGAIVGRVTSDNQPLPGVQMTLASPSLIAGPLTVVTPDTGKFRFVALLPGVYSLEAKLAGFKTIRKEDIRLSVASTLTVDFALELTTIEEEVTVVGVSPVVDVKDSQTAVTTLTKDLIQNIPNNQFVSQVVNLAPGVANDSAFGASDNGVQYQIDGVDVSDPELHTAYVFLDYGVVEEAKIMGVGAPAEYDGFSGIVFNTVTKSGGNTFSGLLDAWLQRKQWNSSNSDDPALSPPKSAYYNVHFSIGGPVVRDKLWFFFGTQYYRSETGVTGFPYPTTYDQPRFFLKLTWQAGKSDRLNLALEQDWYTGKYRQSSRYHAPEATRDQESPEFYFNASYLHVFSEWTFMEAKVGGFISKYLLKPHMGYDIPGHYDYVTLMYTLNRSTYYHAFRNRYSYNASVNHHAEDFIKGSHDFKFGIDGEINPTRTEYGFPGKIRYYDRNGVPYRAVQYDGYNTKATNYRVSAYFMDSWSVSDKIQINPGIRFNYYRGNLAAVGTVFKPQIAVAPRIGITYDIFGDHSTALKFHYGKYYDNIITSVYTLLAPKPDWIALQTNDGGATWFERFRDVWQDAYTIDETIRMPYMHQFTVGLEREVVRDLSVAVNYIYRTNKDMIDRVNLTGEFEQVVYNDPWYGPIDVYNQVNAGENKWIITNIKKDKYPIIPFEPSRKYSGVEFVLNKRFSNNWQVLASYVYGKATGNNDNSYGASNNSSLGYSNMFTDPNIQTSAEGRLYFDPTHMVKIQGSVILPFGINLAPYFLYQSGFTWTPQVYFYDSWQDSPYVNTEPLGSRRYPARVRLDLRLEKIFNFGRNMKLGASLEIFNVFNAGTVTSVTTEYSDEFEDTISIVGPRAFRGGLRFFF